MRPSARLALILLVFFASDVTVAKLEPQAFIPASYRASIVLCALLASVFLAPTILVLFPPRIIGTCSERERVLYAVLVAWFLQVQFWTALVSPVHSQLKFERGDLADGFISSFGIHGTASLFALLLTLACIAIKSWFFASLKTTDTRVPRAIAGGRVEMQESQSGD